MLFLLLLILNSKSQKNKKKQKQQQQHGKYFGSHAVNSFMNIYVINVAANGEIRPAETTRRGVFQPHFVRLAEEGEYFTFN